MDVAVGERGGGASGELLPADLPPEEGRRRWEVEECVIKGGVLAEQAAAEAVAPELSGGQRAGADKKIDSPAILHSVLNLWTPCAMCWRMERPTLCLTVQGYFRYQLDLFQ